MRSQLVLRWAAFAAINQFQIFPNFDCRPSGGERMPSGQDAGCIVQPREQFQGRLQPTFPQIQPAEYGPR